MRAAKHTPRRGVTMVEMLVVVALVVLMMLILVSIFQAATGAISVSRTYQELSNSLRMLDQTLRTDLSGVTARLTPPLDPKEGLGYFEYGENSFADLQGEDTDDYLAFTAKAPEGQYFTGRIWIPASAGNPSVQPVTVTSQFAEIIYFLRDGNLYRRVLLIAPERQSSMQLGTLAAGPLLGANYQGQMFGSYGTNLRVSWQGMNDISARPSNAGLAGVPQPPIPNSLGDLTDRQNRAFRPRFMNDFFDSNPVSSGFGSYIPDGVSDDNNLDDVPDYYPTLYPNVIASGAGALLNEQVPYTTHPRITSSQVSGAAVYGVMPFPYIYPAAYSKPDVSAQTTANGNFTNDQLGWIHSPDATGATFNHAPLSDGDTLTTPTPGLAAEQITWWGFPTWMETMTGFRSGTLPGWTDPIQVVNQSPWLQPWGLRPFPPGQLPASSGLTLNFPPPQRDPFAILTPFGNDGLGSVNFVPALITAPPTMNPDSNPLRGVVWEDDLIMTGVRSFDVKAYDPDATVYNRPAAGVFYNAGYQDLGYAAPFYSAGYPTSVMTMDKSLSRGVLIPALPFFPLQDASFNPVGFGHEGRIPPLVADNRVNPARPYRNASMPGTGLPEPTNVGDDTTSGALPPIRLRRVFDTWSTTYTQAPMTDINLNGSQLQPYPNDLPVYPSYPPPYPSPLRGIQIQIRVTDVKNQYPKILTIRQDFSDKL